MAGKHYGSVLNSVLKGALAFALGLALVSCAGGERDPGAAAKKMLHAYGGSNKAARLQSYIGKGFIKDLTSDTVARSFSFDVYRKGDLYKHKIVRAPGGTISDIIVLRYDGKESLEWETKRGLRSVPSMELGMLKYRFPSVIRWVQESGRKGEIVPSDKKEGVARLLYKDGDVMATLVLDTKSWLLRSVELASSADTSFAFTESYDHYSDVDGVPFPAEFKATFKGLPYYEYFLPTIEIGAELPDSLFRLTREDTTGVAVPVSADAPQPEAKR